MAAELLLDTGPLVALIDADEQSHQRCRDVALAWRGPVVTTEAVITEATHLLGRVAGGRRRCLEFIRASCLIAPVTGPRLERVAALLDKYDDVPMDYADGTLVALAEELATPKVFTLDRRGFETYRWARRRSFEIFPQS